MPTVILSDDITYQVSYFLKIYKIVKIWIRDVIYIYIYIIQYM